MNIRQTSLTTAVVLSLLFISLAAYTLITLQIERTDSQDLQKSVVTSGILNKAIIELSLERSVMQVNLNLPDPISPRFRQLIDEQIAKSKSGFDEVSALVNASDRIRRKAEFVSGLRDLRAQINSIRQEANQQLALPLDQRDPTAVASLPDRMKATILSFSYLPIILKPEDAQVTSKALIVDGIQHEAWAIREFGGRERTYLAIAAATGAPLDTHTLDEMSRYHADAVAAMDRLELKGGYINLTPNVVSQIQKVKQVYFEDYKKTREAMIAASANGEPYPVSFDQFFVESSAALDTAVNLSYLASDEMVRFIEGDVNSALTQFWAFVALLMAAISLCAFQIYFTMVRVSGRLGHLSEAMQQLSQGNTNIDLDEFSGRDEIDHMAENVKVFRRNAVEMENLEREQKEAEARQLEEKRNATTAMANKFENQVGGIVENVERAASDMQAMALRLSDAIGKTSNQSEAVASSSHNATTNVQTVASAAEQMSASIEEIAKNVHDTAEMAKECSDAARVSQDKLQDLHQAVEEINTVIESINDVAEQTNLLALNATIEAARAGDAGKGFAVVASEVKSLAHETHKMTETISQKVMGIRESADQTISSVNQIISQINSVDDKTTNVAQSIQQQSSATNEISQNVQLAASGTTEVAHSIEEVLQAANDSSASTETLKTASDDLAHQATDLKQAVTVFLKEVRSG